LTTARIPLTSTQAHCAYGEWRWVYLLPQRQLGTVCYVHRRGMVCRRLNHPWYNYHPHRSGSANYILLNAGARQWEPTTDTTRLKNDAWSTRSRGGMMQMATGPTCRPPVRGYAQRRISHPNWARDNQPVRVFCAEEFIRAHYDLGGEMTTIAPVTLVATVVAPTVDAPPRQRV